MQTQAILSRLLQCCLPLMHVVRWWALRDVVHSAACGRMLPPTSLALGTAHATILRRRLKCDDRLLASLHLDRERILVYRILAHEWLSGLAQLHVVVDWSPVTDDMQWHMLRVGRRRTPQHHAL